MIFITKSAIPSSSGQNINMTKKCIEHNLPINSLLVIRGQSVCKKCYKLWKLYNKNYSDLLNLSIVRKFKNK